jgi:hypothetical protein
MELSAKPSWLQCFDAWQVAARPDKDEPEWWAGAPSVARDDDGAFWMAARMRTADAPLGLRGYEIRVYRSDDGVAFEPVHGIRREDVPVPGFERPALLRNPWTGRFMLYGCSPIGGTWQIIRFEDAERPDGFDGRTARAVLVPFRREPLGVEAPIGYKDPVVFQAEGRLHCFVIGVTGHERSYHFVSDDGENWTPVGPPARPAMDLIGWHNHAVRPASVLPMGLGWMFIYEGSSTEWPDPAYNIATGLAYTPDLQRIMDLTPDEPLLRSPTPGRLAVWRYSHWMRVGDEVRVYAEVECANGSHEIRVFRVAGG